MSQRNWTSKVDDTSKMLGRIRTASTAARSKGTLFSIETDYKLIPGKTGEPTFFVNIAKNLVKKDVATADQIRKQTMIESQNQKQFASSSSLDKSDDKKQVSSSTVLKNFADGGKPAFNPFLPYEPSMFVQDIGNSHVLLLNKFNVVENHVLLVTKTFQQQSSLLTITDHTALWECISEFSALAFYNAGSIAGASQPHKHLQLIPTPVGFVKGMENNRMTPIDEMLDGIVDSITPTESKGLGFLHAVIGMKDCTKLALEGRLQEAGEMSMDRYLTLLRVAGRKVGHELMEKNASNDGVEPYAYNLLVTREWMMVIPRRKCDYKGVGVNAIGFACCLLVRDEKGLEVVVQEGGMKILTETGFCA